MSDVVFPPNPDPGDTYTSGDATWQWDGDKWVVVPPSMQMTAGKGELLIGNADGLVECLPAGQENQRLIADVHAPMGATWVDVTSTDVLSLLLPVDGSGSGLDADKLDGIDASALAPLARPNVSGSDYAFLPGVLANGGANAISQTPNTDYVFPIVVTGAPATVVDLRCEVAAPLQAGKLLRMGLCRLTSAYQGVGAVLADSGPVDAGSSAGVKRYTLPTPLVLQPGFYGLLYNCDAASISTRYASGWPISGLPFVFAGINNVVPQNFTAPRAFGAFPADLQWSTSLTFAATGLRYVVFVGLA